MRGRIEYLIVDMNSRLVVAHIQSNCAKNALKKFLREKILSTGMYEVIKDDDGWMLSSSYGSYYRAERIK